MYCPKTQTASRPHTEAKPLPCTETVQTEVHCPRAQGTVHCPLCSLRCFTEAMSTPYGFTLLGDLTASTAAKTVKADPFAKTLAMMGEGTGSSKIAAAITAKIVKDADVYFTNGNWITGKCC